MGEDRGRGSLTPAFHLLLQGCQASAPLISFLLPSKGLEAQITNLLKPRLRGWASAIPRAPEV